MKNSKSFRTDRSRGSFRSSAPSAKARDSEAAGKRKAPFRKDAKEKPAFYGADKPKHAFRGKDKGKPAFRTRDASKPAPRKSKAQEPREEVKLAPGGLLIWGLHAVRAAWLNPKRRVNRVWLTESGQKLMDMTIAEGREELLKRPDPKRVERDQMDKLVPPSSVHQGIVIETTALPELNLHDVIGVDQPPSLILMLDQVTDPHNVGAILRSAAAFGAGAVVMTERNAPTTTGVLAKSASGALEYTPMIHVVNLARALDDLRDAGYWSVGLAEEGAKDLGELDLSGRTVIILGNEGVGLRHLTRQKCDELARLPTGGAVGSLNVSNAAAVALYEVRRQAGSK